MQIHSSSIRAVNISHSALLVSHPNDTVVPRSRRRWFKNIPKLILLMLMLMLVCRLLSLLLLLLVALGAFLVGVDAIPAICSLENSLPKLAYWRPRSTIIGGNVVAEGSTRIDRWTR